VSRIRRWLAQPAEALFFLFIGAFALVIGIIYWLASSEPAGTVLMLLFGVATGGLGLRLALDPRGRLAHRRAVEAERGASDEVSPRGLGERLDPGGRGESAEGTGGIDRPFLDESGRLPAETFAPFAVGLGVALASTGLVFGIAPVAVGILPFAWGAWTWLSGARAELDATEAPAAVVVPEPATSAPHVPARNLQGDDASRG
jgi:hypothetical protein